MEQEQMMEQTSASNVSNKKGPGLVLVIIVSIIISCLVGGVVFTVLKSSQSKMEVKIDEANQKVQDMEARVVEVELKTKGLKGSK